MGKYFSQSTSTISIESHLTVGKMNLLDQKNKNKKNKKKQNKISLGSLGNQLRIHVFHSL